MEISPWLVVAWAVALQEHDRDLFAALAEISLGQPQFGHQA